MSKELRPIRAEEMKAYGDQISLVFSGSRASPEGIEALHELVELDRTLAWFEGGRIVASAGVCSFRMTVAGGARLGCAGLTRVTVLPTHRRQGLLTGMMRAHLEDAHRRGEPLAALYASEATIYGRFGYGIGTVHANLSVVRGAAFREVVDIRGRVRLMSREEAATQLPALVERLAPGQPGLVAREPAWWGQRVAERIFFGPPRPSETSWAAFADRGYAAYRVRTTSTTHGPERQILLLDLLAADPEAYRGLWRYVLDIDLADRVEAGARPRSEPLMHLLADPRSARTELEDGVWLRLVDVAAALAGRSYAAEGTLAIEVEDEFCDWNRGTWTLEAGAGGARCERGGKAALAVSAADLATVYLGESSFRDLLWAGRLEERHPGAARLADSMFSSPVVPWCPFHF